MRSKSYLFLLIVLVLGIVAGVTYAKLPYRFGLDIKGGVRFTYAMDTSKLSAEEKQDLGGMQQRLVQILQNRANGPLGVTEPVVAAKGTDQITVELPGFTNLAEAASTMGSSARIEFFWANNVVVPGNFPNRPYVVAPRPNDPNKIGESFMQAAGDQGEISYEGLNGKGQNPRYQQIITQWGKPFLAGSDLAKATPEVEPGGRTVIGLRFNPEGARKMKAFCLAHPRDNIAAVLDGKVISIAALVEGAVLEYGGQITGDFPTGYPKKVCDILNSGSLPIDLKLISSEQVDPTIGQSALGRMVTAGIISFAIIGAFLIAYYSFPGIVALIALALYVLFTLAVMKLINATFSLAGIAGFILSVGMAVDANILVFERFKEEMKAGKSLATGIELGFKRALTAIIDSNACTLLTSFVLVNLGTGPVKGFATTLIVGVLISLFTAVTVTRSLLMFFVGSGIAANPKLYAVERDWFGKLLRGANDDKPLRIVETSRKWFAISLITMVVAIPFFFMGGFRPNVEFRGGYEAVFAMKGSQSADEINALLSKNGFEGGNVKFATAGDQRFAYLTLPPSEKLKDKDDATNIAQIATAAGLAKEDSRGFSQVGPQMQAETTRNALTGVVGSTILIVLYLAVRFGTGTGGFSAGLRFGFSAVGALVHDVIVVIGLAAIVGFLEGWEVSALFLTAMLTIIGFSTHDTIVIFDRIRENLHKSKGKEELGHLIDKSITQSYARSINTSSTVILTLAILAFYGTTTPDLRFFVVAMLIGILSGTYSSIYNASPILYLWDKMVQKKKGVEFGLQAMSRDEAERNRVIQTQAAAPVSTTSGRSYGQVRRRANDPLKGRELDD